MNTLFLSKLFKKEKVTLDTPDSTLLNKLTSFCSKSNLFIYSNIKIYHHKDIYIIPLIMLDPLRGLYIFEVKTWSYDELKDANIQKAQNQNSSTNTLSFDNTYNIIRKKFNEIRHNDGVAIYKYLIMENLSADKYKHLSASFQELLPFEKLIFSDSDDSDIFEKLHNAAPQKHTLPPASEILGTLFIQNAILYEDENSQSKVHLATQEQMNFINKDLGTFTRLYGLPSSGKSSVVLLKALVSLLENPSLKIIILKPTILACDIFKKRLLDMVEYAIVEVDLTSIQIITPLEITNRHLEKLSKAKIETMLEFPDALLNKKFKIADLIICDDSELFSPLFITYLKQIQKKSSLLLIQRQSSDEKNRLTQEFRVEKPNISFYKTNPYAKSLHLIHKLLSQNEDENIIIVSNLFTQEKIKEDLDSFSLQTPQKLDSSIRLRNQKFSQLLLTTYADINTLSAKHIIMLDLCFTNPFEIEYALNIASKSVHILYEEESQDIINLKDKYESTKERTRVEETTES